MLVGEGRGAPPVVLGQLAHGRHVALLGVTERLNAATEERFETGHAVGALSIA